MNPVIIFINEGKSMPVETDMSVLDAARQLNIALESPCNGNGTCGKCKVEVDTNGNTETVLACRKKVTHNINVVTKSKEQENKTLKILAGGKNFSYPLLPFITKTFDGEKTSIFGGGSIIVTETGNTTDKIYGIAVDIGTTTLVTALIDLRTGKELALSSKLNPQSQYAQDVISRIYFAGNADGLTVLQTCLTETLNEMFAETAAKADVCLDNVYEVVYSGNTAMLHFACGADPKPLGQYPYIPQIQGGEHKTADELSLQISPIGLVYLPPIISAFVGADITSGILISQLFEQKEVVLFIDVGTNGEIVLAKNGMLAATSTAAGPAFEGMNITCGMRAGNGAIECFHIEDNDEISFRVIGNVAATGICGSGLLDIVGELVRTGIVGKSGRFSVTKKHNNLRDHDGKKAFFITDNVYLTQNDVRQVQLAKGAIRSGIEALLKELHIITDDLHRVEIAGSFGYHLNENSLIDIGLLPAAMKGKTVFTGNTSLTGAKAFLLNIEFRKRMIDNVKNIEKIELANDENFEKIFVDSLTF